MVCKYISIDKVPIDKVPIDKVPIDKVPIDKYIFYYTKKYILEL